MGPSGCGKSTLLRAINRMHELYPDIRISGEILMDKLQQLDPVAYVRFASVYREFKDVNTFMDEIKKLLEKQQKN